MHIISVSLGQASGTVSWASVSVPARCNQGVGATEFSRLVWGRVCFQVIHLSGFRKSITILGLSAGLRFSLTVR